MARLTTSSAPETRPLYCDRTRTDLQQRTPSAAEPHGSPSCSLRRRMTPCCSLAPDTNSSVVRGPGRISRHSRIGRLTRSGEPRSGLFRFPVDPVREVRCWARRLPPSRAGLRVKAATGLPYPPGRRARRGGRTVFPGHLVLAKQMTPNCGNRTVAFRTAPERGRRSAGLVERSAETKIWE